MAKSQKSIDKALNTPTPDTDQPGIYQQPQGPSKDEKTGLTAVRQPAPGPITIENYGGEGAKGDWAVIDSKGTRLNGPITTAAGLAYWLKQAGYAARVENLDDLGDIPASHVQKGSGYSLSSVALGKR